MMFMRTSISALLVLLLTPTAFARPRPDVVVVTVTVPYDDGSSTQPTPSPAAPAPNPAVPASPVVTPISNAYANTNSKRGLAYNSTSPGLQIFVNHPKITWGHCWASVDFSMPPSIEFVATLADLTPDALPYWDANVQKSKARGSQYLMSLNEPDQPGSKALMDVGSAVASYRQNMNKYAGSGWKLGSPSVTNGVINGMGLTYLSNFLDACTGCTVDFVPVHWYGCTNNCPVETDAQQFKDHITLAMAAARGKPIWIPEFQHLGSLESQKTFLDLVLPWLDDPAQDQIQRYAYFMVFDGFLTSGGQLNEVGLAYVS